MYTLNDIGCAYREAGEWTAQPRSALRPRRGARQPADGRERPDQPGQLAFCLGDYDVAMGLSVEALDITMAIGNSWGQSISLCHSAILRFEQGDLGGAIRELEEGQRLAPRSGSSSRRRGTDRAGLVLSGRRGRSPRPVAPRRRARSRRDAVPVLASSTFGHRPGRPRVAPRE